MRAVVLVGGLGTRLRPLTLTVPKAMLPVAEQPIIERILEWLARHGVDEAVLSMGYRPDAFTDAYPEGQCAGVTLRYAVEPEPLDTAGAIRFAALEGGVDETFLVVNGDVLTDLDVHQLVEFHRYSGAEGTITLTPVEDPSIFGVVVTDQNGKVDAFIEKPPREEAPTNLVNAGTYVLEPSVLDRIPPDTPFSIETRVFPAMVADGRLYASASDAYWIETGNAAKYLQANLDLIEGRRPGPPAVGAVERSPGVWVIGAGVLDANPRPPALIGDAVFVGTGAVVSRSVIGAGARVSEGALVEESVLLAGAVVRPDAVVRRSIVGPGAVVEEGARLDQVTVVAEGLTAPVGGGTGRGH